VFVYQFCPEDMQHLFGSALFGLFAAYGRAAVAQKLHLSGLPHTFGADDVQQ